MSKYNDFRIFTIAGKRVRVDLVIDIDELAWELGKKAMKNKSRKSKLSVGVKAEARELTP